MLRVQFEPYDFNPRSREGSDIVQALAYAFHMDISIHAPARGATKTGSQLSFTTCISIHAPARGATKMLADMFLRNYISIHAPARGATPSILFCVI